MKSLAMTLDLVDEPEVIEKYKAYHREVWSEVISGLRSIGVSKMKIFLLGTRMFMYLEAPDDFDPTTDFQGYTDSSHRAKRWDELMREFQSQVPEAKEGEWWAGMEEVFDIDWF
ncbi:MAG: L-rhamnose mutarotase [Dehalococcoidia bacterium]|nr:L-rhamnose mutarotase [Dehalococcoidia bacterium]